MTTTLFRRLRMLASADAHEVLESLEEPTLLLKQCAREAELELARKRAARDALARQAEALERQLEGLDARMRALDADVDLALGRGEESLARFAIRRLLPLRDVARSLRDDLSTTRRREGELSQLLEAQEEKLEELRARVRAAIQSGGVSGCDADAPGSVADEEVELELLRRAAAASAAAGGAREGA